MKEVE